MIRRRSLLVSRPNLASVEIVPVREFDTASYLTAPRTFQNYKPSVYIYIYMCVYTMTYIIVRRGGGGCIN